MPGLPETLVGGVLLRGLGPAFSAVLMAGPPKKVARAQLKKIYVLNETGDMTGEYVLDADCPIDYNDFLKVLPEEGIGDREALFVGEYVFTAFQSGKSVFVLLSRGHLAPEDIDWTALLLTAAEAHAAPRPAAPAPKAEPRPSANADRILAEREARVDAREKDLAKLEAQLRAEQGSLQGRAEELDRQKAQMGAIADYVSQMNNAAATGMSRALQSLEMAEQIAAGSKQDSARADAKALTDAQAQWDEERKALLRAKEELEGRYREAADKIQQAQAQVQDALGDLERERAENSARLADEERMRAAIEVRVQDLSQRFAQMAKERLMASQKPPEPAGPAAAASQELEHAKAEVLKERKFLQRRAIELLDREERVRDRESKVETKEAEMAGREQALASKEATLATAPPTASGGPPPLDVEEARKDIDRRVKIIQQKAMELLDREEKLRKRAAELQALEQRLSGNVAAR